MAQATFGTPAVNFAAGGQPFSVAVGDFNNDTIFGSGSS